VLISMQPSQLGVWGWDSTTGSVAERVWCSVAPINTTGEPLPRGRGAPSPAAPASQTALHARSTNPLAVLLPAGVACGSAGAHFLHVPQLEAILVRWAELQAPTEARGAWGQVYVAPGHMFGNVLR
jgi:hypothetical protein